MNSLPDHVQEEADRRALRRQVNIGWLLLIGLSLVWGANWTANKIALQEMSPWAHRAYSCFGGGLGLSLICLFGGLPLRVPRRDWRMLVITAFLNVALWQNSLAFAILMMKAGQAAILAVTMPLWTVVLSVLILKEPARPRRIVALALGMAGLSIMVLESMAEGGTADPAGIALILFGAICWAGGTVLTKSHDWSIPPLTLTTWQLLIGGVPSLIIVLCFDTLDISDAGIEALLALAYTVVFAFIFAYYAWFTVLDLFPASVASIGTLLVPIAGMASGWLILAEAITLFDLIAGALIVVGVALAMSER